MMAVNSSQIAMSSSQVVESEGSVPNWSQFVTSSKRHRGAAYRPWAFTEHGAIMAATVLNSPEAVAMSVFVVRAFMQMREQLAANAAILKRLAEIDKTLLEHDSALRVIWTKLQPLLAPRPNRRGVALVLTPKTNDHADVQCLLAIYRSPMFSTA